MHKKVMLIEEWNDDAKSTTWKIACSCGCDEHDITLDLTLEDFDGYKFPSMTINHNAVKAYYPSYDQNTFSFMWYEFKHRVLTAIKVIFTGRINTSHDIILDNGGLAALQFAINEGMSRMAPQINANANAKVEVEVKKVTSTDE